jgi:hypothetical protein
VDIEDLTEQVRTVLCIAEPIALVHSRTAEQARRGVPPTALLSVQEARGAGKVHVILVRTSGLAPGAIA